LDTPAPVIFSLYMRQVFFPVYAGLMGGQPQDDHRQNTGLAAIWFPIEISPRNYITLGKICRKFIDSGQMDESL
jgi:hypothetical protein